MFLIGGIVPNQKKQSNTKAKRGSQIIGVPVKPTNLVGSTPQAL
jgi:hypothetical protein